MAKQIFLAKSYPILQNIVYDSKNKAKNINVCDIKIIQDNSGFIFNEKFNPDLDIYDSNYDNSVPSNFHKNYYSKIIKHISKYIQKRKISNTKIPNILEIGCGNGEFLKQMKREIQEKFKGIGVDPSYVGDKSLYGGELIFYNDYFSEKTLEKIKNVELVILRHTLEHIPNPDKFLNKIQNIFSSKGLKDVPIFIEVPDVDWIFENSSYWDFFYEHVNYFSKHSLSNKIYNIGMDVKSIKNEFGDQYIWADAVINPVSKIKNKEFELKSYGSNLFRKIILDTEIKLGRIKNDSKIVIWGMASKGIIYSLTHMNEKISFDYFVDINIKKQGKYTPKLGVKIIGPKKLPRFEKLSIIVMNPNYSDEIKRELENLKLNFTLYNPNISKIK